MRRVHVERVELRAPDGTPAQARALAAALAPVLAAELARGGGHVDRVHVRVASPNHAGRAVADELRRARR